MIFLNQSKSLHKPCHLISIIDHRQQEIMTNQFDQSNQCTIYAENQEKPCNHLLAVNR